MGNCSLRDLLTSDLLKPVQKIVSQQNTSKEHLTKRKKNKLSLTLAAENEPKVPSSSEAVHKLQFHNRQSSNLVNQEVRTAYHKTEDDEAV